jgi:hypothetical protein
MLPACLLWCNPLLFIRKLHPIFSFLLGGILPYILTRSWKFAVANEHSLIVKEGMTAVIDTPQGVLSVRDMVQTGDCGTIRSMIVSLYETSFVVLPSPDILTSHLYIGH